MPPDSAADHRTFIAETARDLEPDRAIAALLSPPHARDDLLTLAAYLGEIRRIPLLVREPALAEIRLQWWRDALEAGAQGGLTGNPTADEMVRVIARHDLPLSMVTSPLEAASWELDEVDGVTAKPLSEWLDVVDQAETANFQMSARILSPDGAVTGARAIELAGHAYGRCRLALRIPELVARGRWPVRDDMTAPSPSKDEVRTTVEANGKAFIGDALHGLVELRRSIKTVPQSVFSAILPVSLITSYAKAIRRSSRDVLREPAQITPLTRFMRLWWAAKTGRI